MSQPNDTSRGASLAARLQRGRRQAERAARPGARSLPIIHGVNPKGLFVVPQENVMTEIREVLVNSQRVFRHGNSIVLETGVGDERRLAPLASGQRVERGAAGLLSNLLVCESVPSTDNGSPFQFPPPAKVLEVLLTSEPTLAALPKIETYATRPVFDADFVLRGPGWHLDIGLLVHGPEIDPIIPPPVVGTDERPVLDRLPHHWGRLLRGFCLWSDADVANTVAATLTALLVTHFIEEGKPLVLLDGNQPGVGKTLLARVIGMVVDGIDPRMIHYTSDDEELAKRLCATLRSGCQNVVLIDNAKVRGGGEVSSPALEANCVAPEISLRILGESMNYTRPNDLLWFLSMNSTKTASDLASRGLPVRFHFEGDPRTREFAIHNPVAFARRHRTDLLAELAGMVIRWNQLGRPPGHNQHRLYHWATVCGGIMIANGFPEFLANLDEAAAAFNTELDMLSALAEAAIRLGGAGATLISDLNPGEEP